MTKTITPGDLKPRLTAGGEIAFIDVREYGQYGEGHPFFSVNIPYSRLELRVERLIPRKSAPIVLLDDGDGAGLAEMAASRLAGLGYTDVTILEEGARGWVAAGFTLYQGVNLPSKTFGELVEHAAHTPSITAKQLQAMQSKGEAHVLLDGRTPHEYRNMTIPGSRSCPNAELGHRLPQLVTDTTTPVIVNCAGRTRSIIGAQGLINAGVANPVFALENGTQGWSLAGFELERGTEPQPFAVPNAAALAQSRKRGAALAERFAVPSIDGAKLADWQGDETRTLYLLDVRTAEEFDGGHLPGARHAPGGQLVQATDHWVAVRGARIVLCDDTGLRAVQTALWLARMGHDAYVLREDVTESSALETTMPAEASIESTLEECSAEALGDRLAEGARLIDLRPSMDFRKAHLDGAQWGIRPRLGRLGLKADDDIILCGGRDVAELAARDLRAHGCGKLSWHAPDEAAWSEAGLAVTASAEDPPDEACIDYLFFVHDRHHGNVKAMRGYLEWEIALVDQLDEQERGVFNPEF